MDTKITEPKEPVFDENGWCHDLEACPLCNDVLITIRHPRFEDDIEGDYHDIVMVAFKIGTSVFHSHSRDLKCTKIIAWQHLPAPAIKPTTPVEALKALVNGKVIFVSVPDYAYRIEDGKLFYYNGGCKVEVERLLLDDGELHIVDEIPEHLKWV